MESIKWIICHLLAFALSRFAFDLHAGLGHTTAYSYPSKRSPHTGQMCGTLRRRDWRAAPGLVIVVSRVVNPVRDWPSPPRALCVFGCYCKCSYSFVDKTVSILP
jgi:hypothetical protein